MGDVMYLKSIRAYGFKSFADKVDLQLLPGITGIVGPNGSGKSNVVDAVRWVLGEQSVKALRAQDGMTDVIFAGSKSRSGHTRASVSLTFDNTDHYLRSDFNEIEIKRVVYQTGENEYYINNAKVRLKDITDLFLDTGASRESFNIISQGSIADIINSKPEDRRVIFEEAASVLKYKKRKEESLRKMDKTKDNLERVDLIIRELEESLTPLKEQSEKAEKYLAYKSELESTEIALIAHDIASIHQESETCKSEVDRLTRELDDMSASSTKEVAEVEKLKLKSIKIDEEISNKNDHQMELAKEIADLNSEKQIMLERKKYEVDDIKLQNNLVVLKEEELILDKNIKGLENDISVLKENGHALLEKKEEVEKQVTHLQNEKNNIIVRRNANTKNLFELKNKIDYLEHSIESDEKVPYAVKSILNNPRLHGVCNIIGKLIEVPSMYTTAIEIALGYNTNVLVVRDESVTKECISYLKDNKLGRATFFPLNIIKSKFVDAETKKALESEKDYIGIASELVSFDEEYRSIIENQLGNVIVVKNIDALNHIGKKIAYRYRIVSLDGEILHTGGSVTGGTSKNQSGVLSDKKALEELRNAYQKELQLEREITDEWNKIEAKEIPYQEELAHVEKQIIECKENVNRKEITLKDLQEHYTSKKNEIEGTKSTSENRLDDKINELLEKFYQKTSEKELLEKEILRFKNEKADIMHEIEALEKTYRDANSAYHKCQNELKAYEIKLGKFDVKLDNLLLNLNENYHMTYENAKENYELTVDVELAREKVSKAKSHIKELGEVNTGAISEYERINKRYTFLSDQKADLTKSLEDLAEIISEMDEIMKHKFAETFEKIKVEFQSVYKKLFKGGEGVLKLTDPDNLLETGIDIVAQPPGKKLNSIALLSGGEKTLTAIALLFAILNVKPVPFCILDEVEAALDEANVDMFGKYLKEKENKSQFIIITHKKRTMEYADVLYGITMQESGVSKVVSVKLEDIK